MSVSNSFKNVAVKSIAVRFSEKGDEQKVYDFYKDNNHKHVDKRKKNVLDERVQNERVILVEDDKKNIGMGSISYDFNKASNKSLQPDWIEIGSTRSKLNGLGLYPFIIASQVVYEFIKNQPSEQFIANVYDDNKSVCYMLENLVGWKHIQPEQTMLDACSATKDKNKQHSATRKWFAATSDTIPHQARIVLNMIDKGEIEIKTKDPNTGKKVKTGQVIKVDTSQFVLAKELRPYVEALAHGKLAKALEENPQLTMNTARAYLAKHMNGQVHFPKSNP
jgi:nucleoid DNA-binding protein